MVCWCIATIAAGFLPKCVFAFSEPGKTGRAPAGGGIARKGTARCGVLSRLLAASRGWVYAFVVSDLAVRPLIKFPYRVLLQPQPSEFVLGAARGARASRGRYHLPSRGCVPSSGATPWPGSGLRVCCLHPLSFLGEPDLLCTESGQGDAGSGCAQAQLLIRTETGREQIPLRAPSSPAAERQAAGEWTGPLGISQPNPCSSRGPGQVAQFGIWAGLTLPRGLTTVC